MLLPMSRTEHAVLQKIERTPGELTISTISRQEQKYVYRLLRRGWITTRSPKNAQEPIHEGGLPGEVRAKEEGKQRDKRIDRLLYPLPARVFTIPFVLHLLLSGIFYLALGILMGLFGGGRQVI